MSTEITIQQDQIDINVDTTTIVIESPQGGYPLPSSVYSVFGRVGNVVAEDGDYNLTQLGDVTITNPLTGQALVYNGTTWVNNTETYVGTVTSVNMSVPTGLTISGNPITTAGTLALGLASGYSIPTTASQSTWDTAYSRSLTSAAVTGTTTKTLTLNEQGGGTITASWTDINTDAVTSVFGRTGAVVAQSGDYTTLLVPENTNLYFTDQRARYAISGDSNSGVVYSNTTGIIALDDIPNTSLLHDSVTVNGSTVALGGSTSFTTSAVAEGTNLYYTQTRFNSAFAAKTTTDLTEGTNLYFTTSRAQAAISGTSPISVTSGNVSISQATTSTSGYLSSTDWNTFNSKQGTLTLTTTGNSGASTLVGSTLNVPTYTLSGLGGISLTDLSASSPLSYNNTTGAFSIQVANGTQNGYLSSTDWTTFNGKQAALSGTGFVKISGTTISYDNSTYLTTISGIAAGGELSGTYANPSLVNSAVTGKVLTGLNITGGNIVATDSILDAFGKVQNQINGLIGGSIYKGTWNASTNTPTLTSSVGTAGWYYIVNVAGSTNLNGITDWNIGDWAIFNGGVWQKVDNTDAVVSVNGFTGAVSLTTSNISEGTNLYYTDTRARNAISAGTGISYSSSTGVITNSAPDQTVSLTAGTGISTSGTYPNFTITNSAPNQVVSLTGAGTTSISGTYPNFTITSNDQYVGTVTSVGLTSSANSLTITNSPITSSGNIGLNFAGSTSQYVRGDGSLATFPTVANEAQRLIEEVYNETGATLTKGTVVYINSGHGNLPTITKALATSDATSAQTFGLVQADITNNNNGYVVVIGNLIDIDTQAYLEGTQLYLSSTTAGAYTSTKQYAPAHLVYIGIVVRSHPTQGIIAVKVQNGYEMDELHNVSAQSPNNNAILQYKTSTSLWTSVDGSTTNIAEGTNLYYTDARARGAVSLTTTGSSGASTYNSTTGVLNVPTYTLAGLGGINLTSLSATSPLLYNNTTGVFSIQQASGSQAGYLSSADWTTFNSKQSALTNPVTGTGTTNYHAKFTGTSTLGNSLIWDNGTNVGIGNTNTSYTFDVTGTGRFSGDLTLSGASGNRTLNIQTNTSGDAILALTAAGSDGGTITYKRSTSEMIFGNSSASSALKIASTGAATFSSSVTATQFNASSKYAWGTATDGTTGQIATDNTNNYFDYKGNLYFRGAAASNTLVTFLSSGNVGIGTTSPFAILTSAAPSSGAIGLGIIGRPSDDYGLITFRKNDATTTVLEIGGNIASGFFINNYANTFTSFATNSTERMRITSGGCTLINTTSQTLGSSRLEVVQTTNNHLSYWYVNNGTGNAILYQRIDSTANYFNLFNYSGTTLGSITTNGTTTSYNITSDYRLKQDFKDYNGLSLINSIKTYDYEWKADKSRMYGVVAHELAEILPYAVHGEKDAIDEKGEMIMQGVDYSKLVPILVKAIQEQTDIINELKADVELLKAK